MSHPTRIVTAVLAITHAGCGGGKSLVDESTEQADGACACDTFGCTTEYVAWFNEVSIMRSDEVDALEAADQETYLANSLRAADCQDALR